MVEIVLLILFSVLLAYHGFESYSWKKERATLTKLFEEEKRAFKLACDSREERLLNKNSEVTKVFVEEINKMNQGYIKKVEEVYGGPGKDEIAIPDNGSPANDVMLALAEKGKSADFMKSLKEQRPELFKNKGEN